MHIVARLSRNVVPANRQACPPVGVQASRKPSSVPVSSRGGTGDGHLSRAPITRRLVRPYPKAPDEQSVDVQDVMPSYMVLLQVGFTAASRSPGCR